jgi:D-sedoheptulose 7-phosphate isomerase
MSFILQRTAQLKECLEATQYSSLESKLSDEVCFHAFHDLLVEAKEQERKIFVVGNGGSSGIASHHVVDLVNVANVSAFTLSDSNLLTCMGNDYGYETIYARPLEFLASKGDLLIAISSSGRSQNILDACHVMREKGNKIITLSGFKAENPLRSLGDLNIWVDAQDYGLVESAHFFILHTVIDGWKSFLSHYKLLTSASKH